MMIPARGVKKTNVICKKILTFIKFGGQEKFVLFANKQHPGPPKAFFANCATDRAKILHWILK